MTTKSAVATALALALVAGAAIGQQYIPSPHTEHHPGGEPLGRVEQVPPQAADKPGDWPQEGEGPMAVGEGRGMMCPCPMCQMGRAHGQGRGMEMRMKQAGVADETIARARMLMRSRIHPADPQALLAFQDELNLTDEQMDQLRNIIDSAQERALGVLTAEQWDRIRQLKPRAENMMEMHQTVMPQMRAMRGTMRGGMGGGMRGGMMPMQGDPYGRPGEGGRPSPMKMKEKCPTGQE